MNRILLLLPLMFAPLVACGDKDEESDYSAILELDGDISAGETVYSANCVGCHGADGEGVSGPALVGHLHGEEEILEVVFNGEGSMPSFALSDQEAADLLATRQARYAQAVDGGVVHRRLEPPLRTTTLVGRDALLLQLSRGLDRWRQNPQPGVLVLSGNSGSGKTRLSLELTSPFKAQGDIDGHRHRWRVGPTMRETALSIIGGIGLDDPQTRDHLEWWLRGHEMTDTNIRRRLSYWLRGRLEHLPTDDQGRLFAEFMKASTRDRPFVLTLDVMKTIDDQVLGLVYAVRAHRLRVIVLITVERAATATGLPTPGWLKAANRTLGPLDEEALFRIVDELVELPYQQKVELVRQAGGNPKTLLATLYKMQRGGEVVPAWPRWRIAPPGWEPPVPDEDASLVMVSSIITDGDGDY